MIQVTLSTLFYSACPSEAEVAADHTNKSGQLRRVLSTYLGFQGGEAIFTKHPVLGPDCCNDKRATIFPLDKSAKGAMPDLLESGNEIAVAFQRLLGEYFDITPL